MKVLVNIVRDRFTHTGWSLALEWKPQDLWIGAFWRQGMTVLECTSGQAHTSVEVWVCLLPCLPLHFTFWRKHPYR